MRVVIAGAGEVGRHLAKMLSRERHDIILLDPNEDNLAFAKTGMEILPIVGNPTSLHDLENADVRDANLFVSVTTEESNTLGRYAMLHFIYRFDSFAGGGSRSDMKRQGHPGPPPPM